MVYVCSRERFGEPPPREIKSPPERQTRWEVRGSDNFLIGWVYEPKPGMFTAALYSAPIMGKFASRELAERALLLADAEPPF